MATLVLVRHGRTTANAAGVLAGRAPGIRLDHIGRGQAARAAARLAAVPLAVLVTSPLERCRQTAKVIVGAQQTGGVQVRVERAVTECDYGDWQGRPLAELAALPLWAVVQRQPSAAVFPGGESLVAVQSRAVRAVRSLDASVERDHGGEAVWAMVSHGDVIKAVVADALGMHLDLFQRIVVGPASVTVIRYGEDRPTVVTVNSDAGDLSWLRAVSTAQDAPVGGGS